MSKLVSLRFSLTALVLLGISVAPAAAQSDRDALVKKPDSLACSTAGDMVTWLQALHGGKVLSPKSYAEMIAPSKLNDGTPLRYGMGIPKCILICISTILGAHPHR